jgi:O-antigen ligase
MITAFLAGMFLTEIISYGIFFHLWQVGIGTPDDPSPFIHHVYYSAFLLFTIFILLIRFHQEANRKLKIFYLLFATSAIINLFINGGRTGQVAFIVAFIYFVVKQYRITIHSVLLSLSLLIVVYTLAYTLSPVFQKKVHQTKNAIVNMQKGDMHSSLGGRIALYRTAWEVIKEHPFLGSGFGDVRNDIRRIQKQKFPNDAFINNLRHIHNQFLHTYLDAGIVGFILVVLIASSLFSTDFGQFDIHAKIFAITMITLFMVDVPLTFNIGYLFIWTFLGLFFGYKINLQHQTSSTNLR